MSGIDSQLRASFARHDDDIVLDHRFLDGAIQRGERRMRIRRRRRAVAAMAVVSLVVGAGMTLREQSPTELTTHGGPESWSVAEPSDAGVFDVDGDLFVAAVTPWRDELLAIGVVQRPDGTNHGVAWLTGNGIDWERRDLTFPDGCGPLDGVAVQGDRLVVSCHNVGGEPSIGVASTADLANWQIEAVSDRGVWFGAQMGAGPDGVVLGSLEGITGDSTRGATMRIWSSGSSGTVRELVGATPQTLLDANIVRFDFAGGTIIASGMVNEWPTEVGPDVHAVQRPALWISTDGRPFERILLDPGAQSVDGSGIVTGVAETTVGYVAVGNAGGAGIAWTSDDLRTWSNTPPVTEVDQRPARSLWGAIALRDGSVLAAGDGRPNEILAWLSIDGGRTWQSRGRGPDKIVRWDDRVVGVSTYPSPTQFWVWDGSG